MARLRLGLAGLLLLVLAAIGFDLGGTPAAGIGSVWSEANEAQLDPSRLHVQVAAASASASADDSDDDSDDDLDRTEAAMSPARMQAVSRVATNARITTRRHLRPRATGPPALSIV